MSGISQQELTVIELYEKRQELDTQQLLTDYFKGDPKITQSTYSSFTEESAPEIISQSYIMPFGIKAMSLTETAHHITGRNLVLVTTENKVTTLKEQQYSARRPDPPKPDVTPTSVKGVMD